MEEKVFGDKKMANITNYILRRGHDAQLHIDSLYLIDPFKPHFNQYSLPDQINYINYSRKLLGIIEKNLNSG